MAEVIPEERRMIVVQHIYSTADVERTVFYGESRPVPVEDVPGEVLLTAVNGELFQLNSEALPPNLIPLSDESGLLRLANEAEASQ
jgi:hypothetical protein